MFFLINRSNALQTLIAKEEDIHQRFERLGYRLAQSTAQYNIPITTGQDAFPAMFVFPERGCPQESLALRAFILSLTKKTEGGIDLLSTYVATWKRTTSSIIGYEEDVRESLKEALNDFDEIERTASVTQEQKDDIIAAEFRTLLVDAQNAVDQFFKDLEMERKASPEPASCKPS